MGNERQQIDAGQDFNAYVETREILAGYKEKFFNMKSMKHWKNLPRNVVFSPSLEIFKTKLDKTLNDLV